MTGSFPPPDDNESAEEKLICMNCGNDTFWAFKKNGTKETRLFCANCGDPLS